MIEEYAAGDKMPSVAFAFPASGLLFVVGYLCLTAELLRTRTVAKASGTVMIIGVLIFTVGLSGFVPMLVTRIGAAIFGLALVLFGWQLGTTGTMTQPAAP